MVKRQHPSYNYPNCDKKWTEKGSGFFNGRIETVFYAFLFNYVGLWLGLKNNLCKKRSKTRGITTFSHDSLRRLCYCIFRNH